MTIPDMPFPINLLKDGSVVTKDREYLGTWGTDETEALYEFTPHGASEHLIVDPFIGFPCNDIKAWHNE